MGRQQLLLEKKKARRRKIFWFFIFPLILIIGAGFVYGAHLINKAENMLADSYHDERDGKSNLREEKVNPKIDNISILFIGIDDSEKRSQGNARSDALILATLNEKEKSVKLLSIPRDTYVYIDEVGYYTKINHAHRYGGPKATIETVEHLLQIPVDYYVSLNFEAFIEIIDALGGIEIDVPYAFTEQDSKDRPGVISLEAGYQTLNGEEALAFARTRYKDNDIERGKRQLEIIKAIARKATSMTALPKYGQIIDAVGENMKTDLTFDEITALVDYGLSGNLTIETMSLKGYDSWIPNSKGKKVYYYQLDEEALAETKLILQTHLGLLPDTANNIANPVTETE